MFNYDIHVKFLSQLKTYDHWHYGHNQIPGVWHLANELAAEEVEVYMTPRGKPVLFYRIGNPKSKIKFLVKGGHEDEWTYLPSLYLFLTQFLRDTKLINEALSNLDIWILECDDPDGFDKRAWTAVDMRGKEKHWPPEYFSSFNEHHPTMDERANLLTKCVSRNIIDAGGVRYRDENGVYGDEIKSERIWNILQVIDEMKPTVCVDLHGTYRSSLSQKVYHGAGILEIGHYPIEEDVQKKIYSLTMRRKPYTLLSFIGILPWIRRYIQANEGFQLGRAMMENVKMRGFRTYSGKYQNQLEAPNIFPQLIPVDVGRTIMGPLYKEAEIRVCPEYLNHKYGTYGYTTETFPMSAPQVILQNLAYLEGGLKFLLEEWKG